MRTARLVSAHPHINDDGVRTWDPAHMRVVHSQRARKLRRRGVEVIDTGLRTLTGRTVFAWFVVPA